MITFIIATLGSLIFWVIYFMITLVMGTAVMRKFTPGTFESITTGEKQDYYIDWGMYIFTVLGVFIFWPIIIIGYIIKLILCLMVGPMFMHLFKAIDKVTPNISINTNDKE